MASVPDAREAGSAAGGSPRRRVLVTGAAGYLGSRVALALRDERCFGCERVIGVDRVRGEEATDWIAGDLTDADVRAAIDWRSVDAVVHLAALTTVASEQDFDAACALNVDATVALLDAARAEGQRRGRALRFVLASSVGVFAGGEARVDERSAVAPASTYGFTKAVVERYVQEYSRRGYVEAAALRLPVVIVRPSRTGRASAGFLSDLTRALAYGERFACPLALDRRLPVASNRASARALAMLATAPWESLPAPVLNLPAIAASARDAVEALRSNGIEVSPEQVACEPDAEVQALTAGWPERFDTIHPETFGAVRDLALEEIVADYLRETKRGLQAGLGSRAA